MDATERDDSPRSVLARTSLILQVLAQNPQGMSLSELARSSKLPKSTVHRLTAELSRRNVIEQSSVGLRLGLRLFELGLLVPRQATLKEAALPVMEDLRNSTGRTVHLAVLEGHEVVYVEILRARASQSLPSKVGGRWPAHATGVGKAILAFSPSTVVADYLEAGLRRVSPRTITAPGLLGDQLAKIRQYGIAFDREESGVGISCVAAPVFGVDRRVIGALSISSRGSASVPDRMGLAVKMAAATLSRTLQEVGST